VEFTCAKISVLQPNARTTTEAHYPRTDHVDDSIE
jgi:hypothetical protein